MQPSIPSPLLPPTAAAPSAKTAPFSAADPSHSSPATHSSSAEPPPPLPSPSTVLAIPLSLPPLPISALAALLGCTRSTIRHFADRLDFRYTVRCIGPRHKRAACLTPGQANAIAAQVEHDSPADAPSSSSSSASLGTGVPRQSEATVGHFYLLQLEPQLDPGRFKLGFSTNVESRLGDLLTVVPLAKLIAAWPCHRSWERIAIISIAQDAQPLSQEVFRYPRIEDAVAAATRFFAVMPKLGSPPPFLNPNRNLNLNPLPAQPPPDPPPDPSPQGPSQPRQRLPPQASDAAPSDPQIPRSGPAEAKPPIAMRPFTWYCAETGRSPTPISASTCQLEGKFTPAPEPDESPPD